MPQILYNFRESIYFTLTYIQLQWFITLGYIFMHNLRDWRVDRGLGFGVPGYVGKG